MSKISCDVIVLGAGASGLAAAAELAPSGRHVVVLEARDRLGGRIWTRHEPDFPVPIELGAEFIHGHAPATFAALHRAGGAAIDAGQGGHWTLAESGLEPMSGAFAALQRAMKKVPLEKERDVSLDAYLARLRRELTPEARAYARMLAQGFDAADPKRVSAKAIAEEWGDEGVLDAPQYRPLGGYGTLIDSLASAARAAGVEMTLQAIVRRIRWKRGQVTVEGTRLGEPFRVSAAGAIVTLPLGVLRYRGKGGGAVEFSPALEEKRAALARLAEGPVLKLVLRFRTSFWEQARDGRYRDAAFFHAPQAPFPTCWTALPVRAPLLVAWAGGPKAMRLAGEDSTRLVQLALKSLRTMFGPEAEGVQLESAHVHDWQRDPYARGAYSYECVGGISARQTLAAPVRDTLFFAGEASDIGGEAGTVAGAIQSGIRAAREFLDARLSHSRKRSPRERARTKPTTP